MVGGEKKDQFQEEVREKNVVDFIVNPAVGQGQKLIATYVAPIEASKSVRGFNISKKKAAEPSRRIVATAGNIATWYRRPLLYNLAARLYITAG